MKDIHHHQRGLYYEPDSYLQDDGFFSWVGRTSDDWDEGKTPVNPDICTHCKKPYNDKGWCQCKEFLRCPQCFVFYGETGRCDCDQDQ